MLLNIIIINKKTEKWYRNNIKRYDHRKLTELKNDLNMCIEMTSIPLRKTNTQEKNKLQG